MRRGAGGRGPHLHPGGRRGDDAERARAQIAARRGVRRRRCTCRCGRSGSPARCARRCARRSASSRRSTGAAWTSSRRAARSTSPRARGSWATRRRSACARASAARSLVPRSRDGCDRPTIPTAAGPAVRRAARRRGRSTPRSSSAAPGWGALIKHELVVLCAQHVPGALGLALRKALLSARCSARAAATSSSARTSCCAIRTRSASATTSSSTTTACSTPRATANRGITIGSGVFIGRNTILSCKNGDIALERRREHRLQLRAVLGEPRDASARDTLLAAYCYLIGGDHDCSDPSQPVLAQARSSAGVIGRRRRVARRRRQDARRRARSATARSSAPAPSCASDGARPARSPSASRRRSSATRRRSREAPPRTST